MQFVDLDTINNVNMTTNHPSCQNVLSTKDVEYGTPLKFHKISYKFQISVDTFTNHKYTAYSKT